RILPLSFHDTSTTAIYTLSLHDALPISPSKRSRACVEGPPGPAGNRPPVRCGADQSRTPGRGSALCGCGARRLRNRCGARRGEQDRKSTRLNSSHVKISYAVFCLKKKKT